MAHSKKKKYSKESVPEKDLMADISDKDFKTEVLKMLKEIKEDVEKVKKTMCEQNGNISIKKENQKEILDLKSTITKMKNSPEECKGRFEQTE